MTHFENLEKIIPDLKDRRILDVGSGTGNFLIALAKNDCNAIGIEVFDDYINKSLESAKKENVDIKVIQGSAESLPFSDSSFGFLNLSEVIEHVQDPDIVLSEISRVLIPNGKAYVSVPGRFSWFDTHFHIPFLNWMRRSWSHKLIGLLGKHKNYDNKNGKQRIDEMYYTTYHSFLNKIKKFGLSAVDIREIKINTMLGSNFLRLPALLVYKLIRPFYFKAFHFLIKKDD